MAESMQSLGRVKIELRPRQDKVKAEARQS